MHQSIKAAWVALTIIVALAATKFVLYKVSGSIAVLSEAWHSFSDIATTLLVLIAIVRQQSKAKVQEKEQDSLLTPPDAQEPPRAGRFQPLRKFFAWCHGINSELKISLVIGLILMLAALSILKQVIYFTPALIIQPLLTGSIFIGLSFASYFLYRFEENIGHNAQSAALMADGQHNRADMVITLLTGCSLLLYHFGYDFDRWLGLFIAAYILSFALELMVNTIKSIATKRQDLVIEHGFSSIVLRLFQPRTYTDLYELLNSRFNVGIRTARVLRAIPKILGFTAKWLLRAAAVISLCLYVSTTCYTIKPDEKALLLRFGRIVNKKTPIGPGLHLKLPYPIDRVESFQTGKVAMVTVGNTSSRETAMIWSVEHGDNQMFISGDNNLFLPYVVIHFRVADIYHYYLVHKNDDISKLISSMTYHHLNRIFSTTPFYDLMIADRAGWTQKLRKQLQQDQDQLKTGIEIVDVCLRDMHPPINLADAFEDVVAAEQQREKYLNDAERRKTSTLSRERIDAMQTGGEAKSYVVEKKRVAEGKAANYLMRYEGYQSGGGIIKDILLLQSASETLKNKKLYLVDPASGISKKMLYMENYVFGRKGK